MYSRSDELTETEKNADLLNDCLRTVKGMIGGNLISEHPMEWAKLVLDLYATRLVARAIAEHEIQIITH